MSKKLTVKNFSNLGYGKIRIRFVETTEVLDVKPSHATRTLHIGDKVCCREISQL